MLRFCLAWMFLFDFVLLDWYGYWVLVSVLSLPESEDWFLISCLLLLLAFWPP